MKIEIKKSKSSVTGKILKNWYVLYVNSEIKSENLTFKDNNWSFLFVGLSPKFQDGEGGTFISISNIDEIISFYENDYRLERSKPMSPLREWIGERIKKILQDLYDFKNIIIEIKDIRPEDITSFRNDR